MAEALLKRETLNYNDVEALLGPPPFGKKRLIEPEEFEGSVKAKEKDEDEKYGHPIKESNVSPEV